MRITEFETEVQLPEEVVTTTSYEPVSLEVAGVTVRVVPVEPET